MPKYRLYNDSKINTKLINDTNLSSRQVYHFGQSYHLFFLLNHARAKQNFPKNHIKRLKNEFCSQFKEKKEIGKNPSLSGLDLQPCRLNESHLFELICENLYKAIVSQICEGFQATTRKQQNRPIITIHKNYKNLDRKQKLRIYILR